MPPLALLRDARSSPEQSNRPGLALCVSLTLHLGAVCAGLRAVRVLRGTFHGQSARARLGEVAAAHAHGRPPRRPPDPRPDGGTAKAIRSPPVLDHIPLYLPLYGDVQREFRYPPTRDHIFNYFRHTPLSLEMSYAKAYEQKAHGPAGRVLPLGDVKVMLLLPTLLHHKPLKYNKQE